VREGLAERNEPEPPPVTRQPARTRAARKPAGRKSAARKPAPKPAAKRGAAGVRAYIAALPADAQRALARMRRAIHTAVRKGDDAISYGIPCVKRDGKVVIWYAAWKTHVAMYPIGPTIVGQLGDALDGCDCSKGTVRFPLEAPPPAALVRRIVKARMQAMGK